MNIQKAYEGTLTGTTTGVVSLYPAGLPAHLKPSATRLGVGSDVSGEQRVSARDYVFVEDTPSMTLSCTFASTGSAQIQVCNGDPTTAANWVNAGTAVAANGSHTYTGNNKFARVNVTANGSGVTAQLVTSNV
jgi:hypothetical protein